MRQRYIWDKFSSGWMLACLSLLMLLPLAIGLGLVMKSLPILHMYPPASLITSADWSPMQSKFGFMPFILSSVWVTAISIVISAPVCLLAAIYLTQYSPLWILSLMRPVIDILAGIPSVIYGVWGVLVVVPLINLIAASFHIETAGYSIIAGAIVLAIMSIPYILNMLLEVFRQVPLELKEASLSLGTTKWETIKHVVLRKGATGIISAYGLGISKALGETIAVLMVVGNIVQMPKNIFAAGYPLPALIANNYGEMMSIPSYDSALMFGALLLFVIILVFNVVFRFIIYKTELI